MPTNLTIQLEDRPGALAELGETLGEARVNIDGICGLICQGKGLIHLLVEDSERAKTALHQAGIELVAERDVLLLSIQDKPGELGGIARRLAQAGVNLELLYLTASMDLVIGVNDLQRASAAIKAP